MDSTPLLNRGVIATALVTGAAAFGLAAGGIVSTDAALEAATAPPPATSTQNVEYVLGAAGSPAGERRADCPFPRLRRHHGVEL